MVTKEMKVLEVMERYPATRPVFDAYGLRYRVCIPCSSLFDTLEELARARGMSLEELLADLNKAVASGPNTCPRCRE